MQDLELIGIDELSEIRRIWLDEYTELHAGLDKARRRSLP